MHDLKAEPIIVTPLFAWGLLLPLVVNSTALKSSYIMKVLTTLVTNIVTSIHTLTSTTEHKTSK